jgi:hypothetical protein
MPKCDGAARLFYIKNMKTHLHLNNHVTSQQSTNDLCWDLFIAVTQKKDGIITLSIDDGDGDVWKYTINVESERLKNVNQIKEN